MKLMIGVDEVPEPLSELTTYGVAEILEDKYGLYTAFYEMEKDKIAEYLAQGVANVINEQKTFGHANLMGELQGIGDMIAEDFKRMIGEQQFNGLPGVPTMAAQLGKSRRLKNGGKGRKMALVETKSSRPSFEDTGTFEKSISAWFE